MNVAAMRRRAERLARGLAETESTDPVSIRKRALIALFQAVDAEVSVFYNIVELDGRPSLERVEAEGPRRKETLRVFSQLPPSGFAHPFDPGDPPPPLVAGFVSPFQMGPREEF